MKCAQTLGPRHEPIFLLNFRFSIEFQRQLYIEKAQLIIHIRLFISSRNSDSRALDVTCCMPNCVECERLPTTTFTCHLIQLANG